MVSPAPSVFGFHVRSRYELRLLRHGDGGEALDVVPGHEPASTPPAPPLCEWRLPDQAHDATARLYAGSLGLELWTPAGTVFRIDAPRRSIEIARRGDEVLWEAGLWGLPVLLCFAARGDVPLHAAAVEVNGGAILLAGPGGSGKTTLALAFHELGYRVLSEDLACCRLSGTPLLLPGPALLRMRPDMLQGAAPPGTHRLGTRNHRVYLALDPDRRGSGDPVPIRAVVLLQPSADGIRLERTSGAAVVSRLWPLIFRPPTDGTTPAGFIKTVSLASLIPIWQLHRPMKVASLRETVARIVESRGLTAPP